LLVFCFQFNKLATNRPNSIDIALRRPGRFDREIEIDPPNAESRRDILVHACKLLNLDASVDFDVLKNQTNGYVGADLIALCREAGMTALGNMTSRSVPFFI
jgi:ATP-dependent 26S proteasome regulatory subunit